MKKLIFSSLVLSFLGFLDATYLTILHLKHVIPPCTINGTNCEAVLTSQYATVFGIPLALIGSLFYLLLMILLLFLAQSHWKLRIGYWSLNLLVLLKVLISAGFFVSVILVYIQADILHAFCQYCLTSEGINTLIFLLTLFIKNIKE